MKIAIVLLVALASSAAVASEPVGVMEGWSRGATPIHMMRSDAEAGRIDADGNVYLALPTPPASRQTAARTFARCEGLEVEGGEVVVAPAMLFVEFGQGEVYLFPATSRQVADWQASFGETPVAEGAWLQWVHASAPARISGSCRTAIHTPSSGDTPAFEERVDYEVALVPGWNHVRHAIDKLHVSPDGSRHVEHQRVTTTATVPADIRWYAERR